MRLIFFDCFAGISGDMTVAALIDLGIPIEYLKGELGKLNLSGFQVEYKRTERHKISAAKFDVLVENDKAHRHLGEILNIVNNSNLSDNVKEIGRRAFGKLAVAEGKVHNIPPEKVHFHEVGGTDAIIDIAGAAIGIDYFKPDRIAVSPLPLGSGMTKSSHGMIPLPAPATAEILKGFTFIRDKIEGERVTPTGAAVLAALADIYPLVDSSSFEFKIERIGYGAGSSDFPDRPNLLRLLLGEMAESSSMSDDAVNIIECNIDDMNPQVFEHLMNRLYTAGALEVFITPVIMKKSRPGSLLTVLCKKDLVDKLSDIIFFETTTAGVRMRAEKRIILPRNEQIVETEYGPIRMKILKIKDKVKFQPEYDDCAQAAMRSNVPLSKVMESARRAAENLEGIE